MLEIKHLYVSVKDKDIKILNDFSLNIDKGEVHAIMGPNGTGKSTFLKILADKENYTGKIIRKSGLKISYLSQDDDFNPSKTILETVKERASECEEFEMKSILTKLKIDDYSIKIAHLSGGQRKRVALAISLLKKYDLLLLDEPSMGLAPILVQQIFDIIKDINATGTTILLIEQNARMALSIADRGYVMETGKIVLSGTGEQLSQSEEVKKAYLGG